MNSLHAQNGNDWLELCFSCFHSNPTISSFFLGKSLWRAWCHSAWFFCFCFSNTCLLHVQKYNTKPSFDLCSSSHFKCLWKKHFGESSAVNNSTIGILLSTCFLIQEFLSRCTSCIFDNTCLIFIHYSLFHGLVSMLWMQGCGTTGLLKPLKPCVGLMMVPVWARKGKSMCRDLVVHNGYFLTWQDVSLSPVALVRVCWEQR